MGFLITLDLFYLSFFFSLNDVLFHLPHSYHTGTLFILHFFFLAFFSLKGVWGL